MRIMHLYLPRRLAFTQLMDPSSVISHILYDFQALDNFSISGIEDGATTVIDRAGKDYRISWIYHGIGSSNFDGRLENPSRWTAEGEYVEPPGFNVLVQLIHKVQIYGTVNIPGQGVSHLAKHWERCRGDELPLSENQRPGPVHYISITVAEPRHQHAGV